MIGDVDFYFVGVGSELGSIHGFGLGGEGAKGAGNLGAKSVTEAGFATGELADKEGGFFAVNFHVGVDASVCAVSAVVAGVATSDFDVDEAGRFPIVKHEVFVVVFAVEVEFDFYEVATGECVA